ncbi:leucine-rich repeat flightless-interacting protein 2 isoform X14 [Salminus brasiliensis]|uniref:leucine-rich repeat flightless-interacting protein 2 isoform X14 n=1 Tax=Salminus brasiliensis TaxID=930266 RepID=UPI003B82EAEE
MGTQVTGRKRIPNREKLTAEDDALSQIAREAEARLAAKRAARAEAREIRMKELERQQKEVEERSDFLEKGSRTASTLSAATLASLGGGLSRRGSCDTSISADTEASIREIKDSLAEVEEKYRKAMVSNAQLDNEKSNLMYQVDTLRDTLMELEELLYETRRESEEKTREYERERHAHSILQFQFNEMKETLKQSEELLTALERQKEYSDITQDERDALRDEVFRLRDALKKHGIILGSEVTTNGETGGNRIDGPENEESASRLAQDPHTPIMSGDSMLEIRLRKLVEERESLLEQVRKLKAVVEQKQKNGTEEAVSPDENDLQNGLDPHILDLQRDANRQISDLKFKLVKSEQEVAALEQNIIRLEGQVTRYKGASETAEKVEDELKVEKRKLQRELRSALDRIDELEASNSHLSKRLEKMKANRSALLAQQ